MLVMSLNPRDRVAVPEAARPSVVVVEEVANCPAFAVMMTWLIVMMVRIMLRMNMMMLMILDAGEETGEWADAVVVEGDTVGERG